MRLCLLTCILLLLPVASFCQDAFLKPSITNDQPPAGKALIEPVATFTGVMETAGYQVGDTLHDFTLYTSAGSKVSMRKVMALHKPLLLISGSYTCPSFRKYVDTINKIADFYKNLISIYVVYTVEAHPVGGACPYSEEKIILGDNKAQNLLFRQAKTYGERKELAQKMKRELRIKPEILVDGPGNEWWRNFGLAPNKAYLVDRDGLIAAKCGPWVRSYQCNLWCKIDAILHMRSGNCE